MVRKVYKKCPAESFVVAYMDQNGVINGYGTYTYMHNYASFEEAANVARCNNRLDKFIPSTAKSHSWDVYKLKFEKATGDVINEKLNKVKIQMPEIPSDSVSLLVQESDGLKLISVPKRLLYEIKIGEAIALSKEEK